MFLLQRGEIVLDNCHRLLCKQALPDVTQLSNVLHHEGRVIAIYQQIWVLILCRVSEVCPGCHFPPLVAHWADTICTFGAGAMHPVINHRASTIVHWKRER